MNTKIAHAANVWLTTMTLTFIARLNSAADRTSSDDDARPRRRSGLGDDHRDDGDRGDRVARPSSASRCTDAVTNAFESVRNAG